MTENGIASLDDVNLAYEILGSPTGEPLLLIMGLGSPMHWWDDAFCAMAVDRGFQVIRFDNRDTGRSTGVRARCNLPRAYLTRSAPYSIEDMADDAAQLLSQLGLARAHVAGISMGGMIAQSLAIRHPGHVRSLTSMSSSTGNRLVGRAKSSILPFLLSAPPTDRAGYLENAMHLRRAIASPKYSFDLDRVLRGVERTYDLGGPAGGRHRQLAAVLAARDRTPELRRLRLPAMVIHGSADRLVAPSGGRATARAIPGSHLRIYPGMGHDLPRELWPSFLDDIEAVASRSDLG